MAHPVTRKPKPLPPLEWRRIWADFDRWEDTRAFAWEPQSRSAKRRKLRVLVERERRRKG